MYLFKLTPEGQLLGSLEAQGTGITNGHINNVVYDRGILYLYGRYDVVSGEAFTATLAGAPLCSTGVVNLYVTAVDASTLASEWHTNIVGEKDSNNSCIMPGQPHQKTRKINDLGITRVLAYVYI